MLQLGLATCWLRHTPRQVLAERDRGAFAHLAGKASLVDELIADRRAEAARDDATLRQAPTGYEALGSALGDRACLGLAQCLGVRALTADQEWAKLSLGISVKVIR